MSLDLMCADVSAVCLCGCTEIDFAGDLCAKCVEEQGLVQAVSIDGHRWLESTFVRARACVCVCVSVCVFAWHTHSCMFLPMYPPVLDAGHWVYKVFWSDGAPPTWEPMEHLQTYVLCCVRVAECDRSIPVPLCFSLGFFSASFLSLVCRVFCVLICAPMKARAECFAAFGNWALS